MTEPQRSADVSVVTAPAPGKLREKGARSGGGIAASIASTLLAATLAGCATIDAAPFDAFADSSRALRKGADESILYVHQLAAQQFAADASAPDGDGGGKVQDLLLSQVEGDPYGWTIDRPNLPMRILVFRKAVGRLNDALVGYADSLDLLASKDVGTQKDFDALAASLNADTRSIAGSLLLYRADDAAGARDIAIFSTLAIEAFHRYIDRKRREDLRDALRANQDSIAQVSTLAVDATRILAEALHAEYDQRSIDIARGLAPGSKLAPGRRPEQVTSLLELDQNYIARLDLLRSLDHSYALLPAAHAELAAAVERKDGPLVRIEALYAEGKRLQGLYKKLDGADSE